MQVCGSGAAWKPASGHHLARSAVNRRNALSGAQRTVTCLTTGGTSNAATRSLIGVASLLCSRGKIAKRVTPHGVDVGSQLTERLSIGAVDAPRALAPLGDQTRVPQDFEMLRHRRLADRQGPGDLADGPRTCDQPLEHRAPGRIG